MLSTRWIFVVVLACGPVGPLGTSEGVDSLEGSTAVASDRWRSRSSAAHSPWLGARGRCVAARSQHRMPTAVAEARREVRRLASDRRTGRYRRARRRHRPLTARRHCARPPAARRLDRAANCAESACARRTLGICGKRPYPKQRIKVRATHDLASPGSRCGKAGSRQRGWHEGPSADGSVAWTGARWGTTSSKRCAAA